MTQAANVRRSDRSNFCLMSSNGMRQHLELNQQAICSCIFNDSLSLLQEHLIRPHTS